MIYNIPMPYSTPSKETTQIHSLILSNFQAIKFVLDLHILDQEATQHLNIL